LEARIGLSVCEGLFALELQVALPAGFIERAGFERTVHGATRLTVVPTIMKFTLSRDSVDVVEGVFDGRHAGLPELELAHAGRIDDEGSRGRDQQLSSRGGVATFAVFNTDVTGVLNVFAEDSIDNRGFTDAGRSEQRDGAAGFKPRVERF